MVSSSSSSCINSALDDMESLVSSFPHRSNIRVALENPRYRLRNLKTFVLLAGKLENDAHLGSLLITIEEAVTRISREILHNFPDLGESRAGHNLAKRVASDFQRDFESLKEGVDEWYIATSNKAQRSNSLTADEVGEISESICENLVDLPRPFSPVLTEAMEPVLQHMNFLKNLRRFATSRGVDHGQMNDFLAHSEAVAISAAHLCFLRGDDIRDEEWLKGMQSKISMLVQKIKPIDPQVCEVYTQVLSCSKLSKRIDAPTRDMDEDSTIVMKNFIDSLIPNLWDMLRLDTCHVVCLKDNWQLLHEGLRSLRTILNKQQPKDIDEKMRDDIGDMVCDAGVLVCSFYHKNGEIDLGLQDLLERIKVFLAEAKEEVPQTSTFNPSSINLRGFVDFLLENLMEITNGAVEPIVQSRVRSIKEELLYLRTFLGEIVELRHEQEELEDLWNRILEVTYQVEFLIDHLIAGNISDSFSVHFDSVMEEIQNIKTDASKSSYGKRQEAIVKEITSTSSRAQPSQKLAFSTTEIVGFHDEARSIVDRLQRGSKHLRMIAIVGMGGLGKTTLATKVYDDPVVMRHFSVRARCTISQTLDKRKLLLELLDQIHAEKCSELTEDDLAEKLRKYLKGKPYLIFLDDVWTIEAWNRLQASFPDDSTGSRIILTTRNYEAVPVSMLDQDQAPLFLRQLSVKESLELMRRKLFPGEVWPPALYDLGMQIAEKCKGVPLTIVLLAGLLATKEQEGWKEIMDCFSSGIASIKEQRMKSMELSYKHLPDYLKPCFLYFGAFPEDHEVSVRRLIRLWIAEGFIWKIKLKSVKDTAEDYMKDLIGRSLIMVGKRGSMGGFKTCRIHDLVREFCLEKAKGEHFLHLVEGYDELLAFNEPCNLRRLCIHSEPEHLKESKLFCPRARSLLFFSPNGRRMDLKEVLKNIFLVHIFKFVEVLELEEIDLSSGFPSEIELLVQLRYLAIRSDISVIPSWVGNLSMLETLIVDPCGSWKSVSLPDTIWNLQKLKYLYIRGLFSGGGELPSGNLDNSSVLYELDTLYGVDFNYGPSGSMEKQMSKFPNIRKLKCSLHFDYTETFYNIGVPDFMVRIESLHLTRWDGPDMKFELCFPANLKKLTLAYFQLPWSNISTIGGLPNLEVLKLLWGSFIGETWEMEEEEVFPKLRCLKLCGLELVRWTASDDSDDQFPCLEKLVVEDCGKLEEMPRCLESIPTLAMIEVGWFCSEAIRSLVKRIEEEQVSLGNTAFQILIRS